MLLVDIQIQNYLVCSFVCFYPTNLTPSNATSILCVSVLDAHKFNALTHLMCDHVRRWSLLEMDEEKVMVAFARSNST